jgi:hypothetical protein
MLMILNWLYGSHRLRPKHGKNRGLEIAGKKFASANLWLETLEDRTTPSVTLGISVDGMNTTNNSCNCQPPDTIAAAGAYLPSSKATRTPPSNSCRWFTASCASWRPRGWQRRTCGS